MWPAAEGNKVDERQETQRWARITSQSWVHVRAVCFHMCVRGWAMNVPMWRRLKEARHRVSGLGLSVLPLSSSSSCSQARWWMTPNEKFPLLDCWLQPAAVKRNHHLLSIAEAGGALSSGPVLGLFFPPCFGSWTEQQRNPGLQASRAAEDRTSWSW